MLSFSNLQVPFQQILTNKPACFNLTQNSSSSRPQPQYLLDNPLTYKIFISIIKYNWKKDFWLYPIFRVQTVHNTAVTIYCFYRRVDVLPQSGGFTVEWMFYRRVDGLPQSGCFTVEWMFCRRVDVLPQSGCFTVDVLPQSGCFTVEWMVQVNDKEC